MADPGDARQQAAGLSLSDARGRAEWTVADVSQLGESNELSLARDVLALVGLVEFGEVLVVQVRRSVAEWETGSTPMADLAGALAVYDMEVGNGSV